MTILINKITDDNSIKKTEYSFINEYNDIDIKVQIVNSGVN